MPIQKYYDEASKQWKAIDSGAINDGNLKYTPQDIKGIDDKIGNLLDKNTQIDTQLAKKVNSINGLLPDANGNVVINISSGEVDYVRVKDFTTGSNDSAKIQAAIDHAATTVKKQVVLDEKNYTINSKIIVKAGVELVFGYNTHFYVYGTNYNVLELEKDTALINPNITVDDVNFTGNVIYLDGKHKYYNSWYRTRIVNPRIANWSGSLKGVGIYLYAAGQNHEVSFVNFENAKVVGFNTGVKLKAVKPTSGISWVNANRFTNLTVEDCITLIDIDSEIINLLPATEASGNMFQNMQLQLSPNTTTAIRCSSQFNIFDGITWDDAHVPTNIKLFKFTNQSADNDMTRLHIHTESRVEDLGNRNKTKFNSSGGAEGIPVLTADPTNPTVGQAWFRSDITDESPLRVMTKNGVKVVAFDTTAKFELVRNGEFTTDLTGWTGSGGTVSSGQLSLAAGSTIYQDISVSPSTQYTFKCDIIAGGRVFLDSMDTSGNWLGNPVYRDGIGVGQTVTFTTEATCTKLRININNNTTAAKKFDDISLK
ncbi:hypothetical protein [Bacillus infantis]|uniref:hypothetical protein n=1 Tax=Bacillus infantis TaxID=324767 RepID=UPI0020A04898|nr:hypothetical protein [Bacillus infantis]MCP1159466.1 hypothetical protein [Bacillus infantis]